MNDPHRHLDEGFFAQIDGLEQWLTIRGADRANPAVLVLGGPGGALSAFAPLFAEWEAQFTVVHWDQPGAGVTEARNRGRPEPPLTLERLARDAIEVAEHVLARLRKRRLVLLGVSGGSLSSLTIASRRPELLSACVGTGQFVEWAAQDAASYALVLGRARARGDAAAVAELEAIGPPPYRDTAADAIKSKHAGALTPLEAEGFAAALAAAASSPPAAPPGLVLREPRELALEAYDKVRADIVSFDARRLGRSFGVPMFFFQGEHDAYSITDAVRAYVDAIEAPVKRLVEVPGAGHSTLFAAGALLRLLVEHVRPIALAAERRDTVQVTSC